MPSQSLTHVRSLHTYTYFFEGSLSQVASGFASPREEDDDIERAVDELLMTVDVRAAVS